MTNIEFTTVNGQVWEMLIEGTEPLNDFTDLLKQKFPLSCYRPSDSKHWLVRPEHVVAYRHIS